MATSRRIGYCQPCQDKTTQSDSPTRTEYDDGSDTLAELETIVNKVTMVGKWINIEADKLDRHIKNFQIMKNKFETDLQECRAQLLRMLRKQEEKTREIKKLNLLIFETAETEGLRRTDEQSKKRAENICRLATNIPITVQWATQLGNSLPGLAITRVRFFTEEDKMMVQAGEPNVSKLGVFMDNDLTGNELKEQMNLDEMAEKERAKGKETIVSNETVCINGVYHTVV